MRLSDVVQCWKWRRRNQPSPLVPVSLLPSAQLAIIEYLEEDPANAENVARIRNYLAVNGAK